MRIEGEAGVAHFRVEVADDKQRRQLGLMYRRRLAPERGMLFVWPRSAPRYMWMKNTLIPLDMLFIDDDGRVIHIARRATPLSLEPIGSGEPARAVLELAGGVADARALRAGDRVCHRALPRCPAPDEARR